MKDVKLNLLETVSYKHDCLISMPLPEFHLSFNKKWNSWVFDNEKAFNAYRFDLNFFKENSELFQKAYDLFSDELSKKYYEDMILFSILGPKYINTPNNHPEYWKAFEEFHQNYVVNASEPPSFIIPEQGNHNRFKLEYEGQILTLETFWNITHPTFLLNRYRFKRNNVVIAPAKDDIVIDGGAFHAQTSLYYSTLIGEKGRIFSFEIDPNNQRYCHNNLKLNPNLADRIEIVEMGLGQSSTDGLYLKPTIHGMTSYAEKQPVVNSHKVDVISIDEFVREKNLERVNFIKLDIPNLLIEVLMGAENTIIKFKPKLAISIDEKPSDFYNVILYLDSLNLGYKFYFNHYSTIYYSSTAYATVA